MKFITFPQALIATGLLGLTLALAFGWQVVPLVWAARYGEEGPSVAGPIGVLALSIAIPVGTLVLGLWRPRHAAGAALTFPRLLLVVGLLGLAVVSTLSVVPVAFLAAAEWVKGNPYSFSFVESSGEEVFPTALVFRNVVHSYGGLTSIVPSLIALAFTVAIPLAVVGDAWRRMCSASLKPETRGDVVTPERLLACLALITLMVAVGGAPLAVYVLTAPGWPVPGLSPLQLDALVPLVAGTVLPVAVLLTLLLYRLRRAGPFPPTLVAICLAVLVLTSVGVAAQQCPPLLLLVGGVPLVGLLFAKVVASDSGNSTTGVLPDSYLLFGTALVGLAVVGFVTPAAILMFEIWRTASAYEWTLVMLAVAYAINFGILAAAVWRLRVESRQEPVPEPESA